MVKCFALLLLLITAVSAAGYYDLKPFKINIAPHEVERMDSLVKLTRLPSATEFSGSSDESLGMTIKELQALKNEWVNEYDWTKQQASLNKFHHYTAKIENVTLHFVHEKSDRVNAIPLLMAHGWPGSFLEYLPTVPLLTQSKKGTNGRDIAFDVIIPSLPGFGFSSLPSAQWTPDDTARVFNTLMVEVLGYKHYTVFGSDWGCVPTYTLYSQYQDHVKAAHFDFIPFFPPTADFLAAENITLTSFEQEGFYRSQNYSATGSAYFSEQTTKPNTIGLALLDNPIGQLAWIGQLMQDATDPDHSSPSTFTSDTILTTVSLYYLTRSFLSSVWIYTIGHFHFDYNVVPPKAHMGFSAFRYNPAAWPRKLVEKVGNLTVYAEHQRGGHFPGIDNPTGLVADIRALAEYWEQ